MCCQRWCKRPRFKPYYLCASCIRTWVATVTGLDAMEMEKRVERATPVLPKPRGGGGMPVREYFGLAASAK